MLCAKRIPCARIQYSITVSAVVLHLFDRGRGFIDCKQKERYMAKVQLWGRGGGISNLKGMFVTNKYYKQRVLHVLCFIEDQAFFVVLFLSSRPPPLPISRQEVVSLSRSSCSVSRSSLLTREGERGVG